MMKRTLTAATLAVLLAAPAFAQSPTPPAATPPTASSVPAGSSGNFVASEQASDWRGSKVIGATVYGSDNASIGEVNDVLIGSDGKINAVVIGVGGFLGVGEKNVAVSFDKLTVNKKADTGAIEKITVSFSKDELKNAPTFAYIEPAKPSTTTGSASQQRPSGLAPMGSAPSTAPSTPRQ